MLSYFGLSNDPSEKLSKKPSIYGKFAATYLQRGGGISRLEDMKSLLVEQDAKIKKLAKQEDQLSKSKNDLPITREEVLEVLGFTSKLNEIKEYLNKILG